MTTPRWLLCSHKHQTTTPRPNNTPPTIEPPQHARTNHSNPLFTMASLTKLNADSHLLLEQPLLRFPHDLSRRNFKTAQRYLENGTKELTTTLAKATKAASKSASPAASLESLDAMIQKMQGMKRKLEGLHEEELRIHKSSKARLQYLQDLYDVQSLDDVKYEDWSQKRLVRLLVDYLLREGYVESATQLAESKGVNDLVDVEAFVACHRIERSLREGKRTAEALKWCMENGQGLKRLGGMLEFELRLQQYIEMVRQGHEAGIGDGVNGLGDGGMSLGSGNGASRLVEARLYAKKYLSASDDFELVGRAAGLLAYRPWDGVEPYASLYSTDRWNHLAEMFLDTHHTLFSLPVRPLLHIALSAGLSALKTPSCHSTSSVPIPITSSSTPICPICSTELKELARNVPYAHHTKSIVESDLMMLPNGNVCGSDELRVFNEKVGTVAGWVRDPLGGRSGEAWKEAAVQKVYIL
ncbi:protein FYV10 [Massariosphaeria phaeospora]|uniref:Protein FYV10 n=1 Tax=Massariosphaeria phaeospora TaxID=100035 RepID=A0A7C8M0Y2_9PLEO|nr:protein FYV10 [Massariosphaeria phaeospora]